MTTENWTDRALEMAGGLDATREEVANALSRSEKFFRDLGEPQAEAEESAKDLVCRALEAAPRFGFDLDSMLRHIMLSYFHRVPERILFAE